MPENEDEEELIRNPELRLEDVRNALSGTVCSGRGSEAAAARGYNTERLAAAVFSPNGLFLTHKHKPWFDTRSLTKSLHKLTIECKCCIDRYPSGGYGQFRIWQHSHALLTRADVLRTRERCFYFFCVYTLDNDQFAKEIGKLVVKSHIVDKVIINWSHIEHPTMGSQHVRDISWRLLLDRLGVSVDQFREEDLILITER